MAHKGIPLLPQRPVFGFAVLGDLQPGYRSGPFGWRLGDGALHYRFERAKLLDFQSQERDLESNANPFALVVLAHLYSKTTKKDLERRRSFKLKLIRLLLRRSYARPQVEKLFQVIDWMVRLDTEQDIIFKDEVRSLVAEGNEISTYVSTFEVVTRFETLHDLLTHRFGELPAWVEEKLKRANNEMLKRWTLQLLDAGRIEEVCLRKG